MSPLSRRLTCAALLLLASRCGPPPPAPSATGPLTFFDSDAFDNQLATRLTGGPGPIQVTAAGAVSVNDMPKRLGAWLAAAADRGGQVVVVNSTSIDMATGKPRFIGGIVAAIGQAFVTAFITTIHEHALYGTIDGYDITLSVAPGSGKIETIYFTRR